MKKPAIPMAILIVFITITQMRSKKPWGLLNNEKLKTTSCRGLLVPLEKKIPSHWKISCEENNLAVEIDEQRFTGKDVKPYLYRQLANHLIEIAKNAPNDLLERVYIVRVKQIHSLMEINAVTEGKYLVKLSTMTSQQLIADHLQTTVQIKETLKTP